MRVSCAVLEYDGRVLLCRRSPGRSLGGLWEFPGGKVETGETPEAALARELEEELGIPAIIGNRIAIHRHRYPFAVVVLTAFAARYREGGGAVPRLVDHDAAEWIVPADWTRYPMSPADIPIARLVEDRRASGGVTRGNVFGKPRETGRS
jgi:8-oxo-dGTP diphosphatase